MNYTLDMQTLFEDVENYPDTYHKERAQRPGMSVSGIAHALKRLGVAHK